MPFAPISSVASALNFGSWKTFISGEPSKVGYTALRYTQRVAIDNVFADLGLPNSEQALLKARLTRQIYNIIRALGLRQSQE